MMKRNIMLYRLLRGLYHRMFTTIHFLIQNYEEYLFGAAKVNDKNCIQHYISSIFPLNIEN